MGGRERWCKLLWSVCPSSYSSSSSSSSQSPYLHFCSHGRRELTGGAPRPCQRCAVQEWLDYYYYLGPKFIPPLTLPPPSSIFIRFSMRPERCFSHTRTHRAVVLLYPSPSIAFWQYIRRLEVPPSILAPRLLQYNIYAICIYCAVHALGFPNARKFTY